MSTTMTTTKTKAKKPKKKEEEERQPAASATPDRGEEASLEKQAKPAFSPSEPRGSPGMGPGPATSVVGSTEGVVEAIIPDGPSAADD